MALTIQPIRRWIHCYEWFVYNNFTHPHLTGYCDDNSLFPAIQMLSGAYGRNAQIDNRLEKKIYGECYQEEGHCDFKHTSDFLTNVWGGILCRINLFSFACSNNV